MFDNEKINWEDLRIGYNQIYNTNHQTIKSFLSHLYKIEPTLQKVGKILGVAHTTVRDEMIRQDIPRLPKGWRGRNPPCLKAIYTLKNNINIADLTYTEIAHTVNFSVSRVYALLSKNKIPYRRQRKRKKFLMQLIII